MSAFADRRNEALAGYTDLRDFAPPPPPVCQAEADWIAAELAGEIERVTRLSKERAIENRAEQRARCTVNWGREFAYVLQNITRLRALRRHNGFDDPLLDEGRELIHRVFRQVCEPDHKGGNEG